MRLLSCKNPEFKDNFFHLPQCIVREKQTDNTALFPAQHSELYFLL